MRQPDAGHQRERLEPAQRLGRAPRVDGAQRPVVTGRQRAEHVERLAAPHLADHDPVRPHAQRVADEPADVISPRPSRFGGLDSSRITCGSRSDSSAASSTVTTRSPSPDEPRQRIERRRLPRPGAAPDEHGRTAPGRPAPTNAGCGARQRPPLDQLVRSEAAPANRRTVSAGPSTASGGITLHARSVRQPRVAQRLRLVHAPPHAPTIRSIASPQLAFARTARRPPRAARPPRPTPAPARRPASPHPPDRRTAAPAARARTRAGRSGRPAPRAAASSSTPASRLHQRADPLLGESPVQLHRRSPAAAPAGPGRARRGRPCTQVGGASESSPPVMNRPADASASAASGRKDQNTWKTCGVAGIELEDACRRRGSARAFRRAPSNPSGIARSPVSRTGSAAAAGPSGRHVSGLTRGSVGGVRRGRRGPGHRPAPSSRP